MREGEREGRGGDREVSQPLLLVFSFRRVVAKLLLINNIFSVQCPATVHWSTATYSCDTGYELMGESRSTCSQSTGMWSTAAPNCITKPALA